MNKEKFEKIKNYLESLENDDIVDFWNEYCRETNVDDEVYLMSSFNEMFSDCDLLKVVGRVNHGYFDISDSYFMFEGNGNLISFNLCDIYEFICLNELVKYIIETKECFNDKKIEEILNEN